MNVQPFDVSQITQRLLSATMLRRNTGQVLDKLAQSGGVIITKDGRPVAELTAISPDRLLASSQRVDKIKTLLGGFSLGIKQTPKQLNKDYDKVYDEMLP